MTDTLDPARLVATDDRPSTRVAEAPPGPDRRWKLGLAALTAVGLAVRVAWVLSTPHLFLWGDAYYYHYQANLLASGHGLIEPFLYLRLHQPPTPSAYHPPLWVLYLAAFSAVGLKSWLTHRLAGCLLGAVTVALIGLVGRRVAGPRAGLLAAGVAAVYPMIWINDGVGMSESMVLATCAAAVLLAYRLIDRPSPGRAAALGVACGLAALSRSEQILLVVALAVPVIAWRRQLDRRRRLGLAGVCLLATGLTLSPWVGRNLVTFHHPVIMSTNLEATLLVTNCPATYDVHSPFFGFWDVNCITSQPVGDESDKSLVFRHQALTFVGHHKRQALTVAAARVGRLWNLYRPLQGARLDQFVEGRPLWASQLGLAAFALLVPLALAGAFVLRRRRTPLAPLAALPIVVTVTAVLIYGTNRFRAPAEITLVVLAAVATDALASRRWPSVRAAPVTAVLTDITGATGLASNAVIPAAVTGGRPGADTRWGPETAGSPGPPVTSPPVTSPSTTALPSPATAATTRFPCFDGYRALAALAVLMVHVSFLSGFSLRHPALGNYTARLDIGVAVFFLISGFLLYRPFVAAHFAGRTAPRFGPYLRRRILRIVPAYWAALTLIAYVFHDTAVHGVRQAIVYYGFLQIYWGKYLNGGITQAWSLCTELSFYLFLPLWALVVRSLVRRRQLPPSRVVGVELMGVVVLYGGSLACRAVLLRALFSHRIGIAGALYWLPSTLDLFALGMALAIVSAWAGQHHEPPAVLESIGAHPWLWWGCAAITYWVISTRLGLPRDLGALSLSQWMGREVLYGLFSLFLLLPGVFGRQDRGLIRRLLRNRLVQAVGLGSYAIYLWHTAAIDEFHKRTHTVPFSGHFPGMVVFVLVASFAVATLSYVVVERPALRLKGRT